ncbi:MAG TPA: hypothetical protein VIY54_12245 [Steroidobacteraceae bacterium]
MRMRIRPLGAMLAVLGAAVSLTACNSLREPPPFPSSPGTGVSPDTTTPPPQAGHAVPSAPQPEPYRPAPRQYRLGPAATALVTQAHKQANSGDFGLAAATIERAMRIEPQNPLLWIELGRVRLSSGDYGQANGMAHKALAMATGDPLAQASAYRLMADSLRALKRNQEAAAADERANALSPR